MIEKNRLKELIKSYLPQVQDKIIEETADNIIQDAEAIIHSMVRQSVNQLKENVYRKNMKD